MLFTETILPGAFVIDIVPIEDERGFFARTWAPEEFLTRGLDAALAQCNASWNKKKGTLRGMHFQNEPFGEVKIVRCTSGAMLDVIVDLRKSSPTYRQWTSAELTASNHRALYIPKGLAHGFITLTDDVEGVYHVSAPFSPAHATGVRWNDPAFNITRPFAPTVIPEGSRLA
jgi:dTDP-4-dehydrorhamnose 3,5-epimerase